MSDEQRRFDREFTIIATCDTWLAVRAYIDKLHHAAKPYLDVLNEPGAK
jgi:hypothetical protein